MPEVHLKCGLSLVQPVKQSQDHVELFVFRNV